MSFGIIIAIIAILIAASSGFLIKRQRCVNNLNRSIQKTIDSIRQGRNCKVAIFEDFREHERLILDLLPYLLFIGRCKTEQALKQYSNLYKAIGQDSPVNILGANWQYEIDTTLKHLENLQKKR